MYRENKFTTSVLLLISLVGCCLGIRVCPTEGDYNNIFSKACHDNPDAGASPKAIVDRWGISTQTEHYLETLDGYIFQVLQCVPLNEDLAAAAVVMGHGIGMNMRGFLNMQNETTVYNLLKQQRRQVFLIAFRGSVLSTETTNGKSINTFAYWEFTYEDLKDEVEKTTALAKSLTNRKVFYVGYSLGSTAGLVLCSLKPKFCSDTLIGLVGLAPVSYLDVTVPSAFCKLAPTWPVVEPLAKAMYNGRIMPRNEAQLQSSASNSLSMRMFYNQKTAMFGNNPEAIPWEDYPVCIINNPDAMPHNVITHYDQNILSGQFRRFDHKEKNMEVYGTLEPPNYAVQDIPIKVSQMTGKNDLLATEQNANKLRNNLSPAAQCTLYSVDDLKFTHENFLQHINFYQLLVVPFLSIIKNMEAGIC